MTTEDDFQRALDAAPDDHNTRLVLADWLEERGDPRAEGYRALGRLRRRLWVIGSGGQGLWILDEPDQNYPGDLPYDWFRLLRGGSNDEFPLPFTEFGTRREGEDAAAVAFAQLPAARRAELLAAGGG